MQLKSIKNATSACFLLLACLMLNTALAQDRLQAMKNTTPEQRAQMQTAMMKNKLQLDTLQVNKIQAINLNYARKMEPVLKGDGGKLAKFKQAHDLETAKDKELKMVFTAEQYKQYEAFKQQMKEQIMDRMKSKP